MEARKGRRGRIRMRALVGSLTLAVLLATLTAGAFAAPGVTEMVSVRSNGKQGDNISARFSPPAISANGLVVA